MKTSVEELACLGGAAAFSEPLHVGRPNLGDRSRFRSLVEDALDRRWLTNDGPYVGQFEQLLASRQGVKHCVATSSGSTALELLIRAAGLSGEVIVPSFTFAGTAHALSWQGIEPVFCDIDADTYTIDSAAANGLINRETTGILGVHLFGRSCQIEALEDLASDHDLTLIFDGAQAFGSSYGGIQLGRFGTAEVLSFHATKVINSIEGGAVLTDDYDLAERIRLFRSHGFAGVDRVVSLGTNAKMNEISAAMGIASLEAFDAIVEHNAANFASYERGIRSVPGVHLRAKPESETDAFHYVVIEVDPEEAGLSRDELQHVLHAEMVLARRYFYPGCHRMEPYRAKEPRHRLTVTERAAEAVLCLPTGQTVDEAAIQSICAVLGLAVENAEAVHAGLTGSGV